MQKINMVIVGVVVTCTVIVYHSIPLMSQYEASHTATSINQLPVSSKNTLPATSTAPPTTSPMIKITSNLQQNFTEHRPTYLTTLQTVERFTKNGLIGLHPQQFCCELISEVPLEKICPSFDSKATLVPVPGQDSTNCTCTDFLYCRLVVLTAISSNHFHEAQDMFASVQAKLPYTRLIVYDLGLSVGEKTQLSKYCNVEVRTFNASKYPLYVRNLHKFAWKPIIISEITKEYEVVLYGDASIRMYQPVEEILIPLLHEFPFVPGPIGSAPIIALTHDSTMNFLGLNMSREMAIKEVHNTVPATLFCVWFTKVIREKWLKRWLDCALHEECIAPPQLHQTVCHWDILHKGDSAFIGCHRFDQSALDIILYQEFGRERWKQLTHTRLNHLWGIHRNHGPQTPFYTEVKTSGC